jgi:hypothetical protein
VQGKPAPFRTGLGWITRTNRPAQPGGGTLEQGPPLAELGEGTWGHGVGVRGARAVSQAGAGRLQSLRVWMCAWTLGAVSLRLCETLALAEMGFGRRRLCPVQDGCGQMDFGGVAFVFRLTFVEHTFCFVSIYLPFAESLGPAPTSFHV